MSLLFNSEVGIFCICEIFRMSFLKHAEDLLYFFCFTCQKEQTIRGLASDNTAFPLYLKQKELKS